MSGTFIVEVGLESPSTPTYRIENLSGYPISFEQLLEEKAQMIGFSDLGSHPVPIVLENKTSTLFAWHEPMVGIGGAGTCAA